MVLEIETGVLCVLSKYWIAELHPYPPKRNLETVTWGKQISDLSDGKKNDVN
jgi:hypothetical protein